MEDGFEILYLNVVPCSGVVQVMGELLETCDGWRWIDLLENEASF
jgi:hypothetical protein